MKRLNLQIVCMLIIVLVALYYQPVNSYLINVPPVENSSEFFISLGDTNATLTEIPFLSEYPNYCYDIELDRPYKNGTVNQRLGSCEVAICMKDLSIQIRGCDDPVGPIFCRKIPANYNLPYPRCCPKIACV